MAKIIGAIVVDAERCKGCALCTVACPQQVISLSNTVNHKGYNYAVQEDQAMRCNGCTSCAIVCPDGCISVYRVKVQTEQASVRKPIMRRETAMAV